MKWFASGTKDVIVAIVTYLSMTAIGEDAVENSDDESDMTVSAEPLNEDLYIEDPKKALRGFFEREGI